MTIAKRARLVVEHDYERRLNRERPVGAIFALKNMGWTDQRELVLSGHLKRIDVERLPDAVLERITAGEHPLAVLASWLKSSHDRIEQYLLEASADRG